MRKFVVAGALSLLVTPFVNAQPVDVANSRIAVVFEQMGVPVEAQFTRFSGDIAFDAQAPANTTASLTVDVSSFDLGDPEYNKEVRKPEWFDAAKFASAMFVAKTVKVLAPDRLEAAGTLTIKGRAQAVVVPIAVQQKGSQRTFSGELPIKRLAFNIGEGEWKATDMVADDVKIRFTVVTAAQ
jgi:polyisoprenoid-binding protein YceI